MGEVAPSRVFWLFGSFNAPAYPDKRGFSHECTQNVFMWCVPLGSFCLGSNLPDFYSQNHSSTGQLKLYKLASELIGNAPYC